MAERRSALIAIAPVMVANARASLSESHPAWALQISAWPATVAGVESALARVLGMPIPDVGAGSANDLTTIAVVAPGRYLVSGTTNGLAAGIQAALPASDAAVTDVSHGHTVLRLVGEAAEELLSRCVTVDLHPSVFPPGRVARAPIHHIDVVIHRLSGTTFELWASRSFAEGLAEWILDASLEIGVEYRNATAATSATP